MAIPWNQLSSSDAQCVFRNLEQLLAKPPGVCPFTRAARDAWAGMRISNGEYSSLKRWIEQYLSYDQWELIYDHCVSTPGQNGQLLESWADAGKNKGLLT